MPTKPSLSHREAARAAAVVASALAAEERVQSRNRPEEGQEEEVAGCHHWHWTLLEPSVLEDAVE